MRPISFLHCADLHLDRPFSGANRLPNSIHEFVRDSAYRSLRRIVDLAISNKVDFVLFAGDLFDTSYRSLKAQMTLLIELQRLHDAGIYSYLSHGNHDALDGEWVSLTWPESSYFFPSNVEAIPFEQDGKILAYIHAFSYPSRHVNEKMIDRYFKVEEGVYQIGMLHGNLEGQTEHSSYAPFSLSELVEKGFDYWALGHIHQRAHLLEEPPVIYPGNIQGAHRKETGAKGCYLVTLSEASPLTSFHQTSDVTWHRPTIDLEAFDTMQDLLHACEDLLNKDTFASDGHLLEIELTGISHLHTQLLQEDQLEDLLLALQLNREMEENHFVWPYKFSLKSKPAWDRQVLEQQEGFIKDILVTSDHYQENDLRDALAPLFEHRRAKKVLETIDDQDQLMKEAEELLLSYLIENNGGDVT